MKLFRTVEMMADSHYCVNDIIRFDFKDGEKAEVLKVRKEL